MSLAARIGLEHPVVQAGMGGGIAGAALAGAVSAAGGLGTVGIMGERAFTAALAEARERAGSGRPLAANLLVPFTRRGHVEACLRARVAVVVLHGGTLPEVIRTLTAGGIEVLQTVGTREQARRALADGATGLVAQGRDAGGHLVGVQDTPQTLAAVLEVAGGTSVWAAGGVAGAADTERLLAAGADAAVAGTRFVLSTESAAHPGYKQALVAGTRTVDTKLFGFGWPMRHRVLVNDAVERWGEGPAAVRALNERSGRFGARLPLTLMERYPSVQRLSLPVFTAGPALAGMPDRVLRVAPLYAGTSVAGLHDVIDAAEAVARLTPPGR